MDDTALKFQISRARYVWLTEFYHQWYKARGKKVGTHIRAFRRNWTQLLDDSSLHSAEDRNQAKQEAEELDREQNIKLHRKYARSYIILQIELPLNKELWLQELYKLQTPERRTILTAGNQGGRGKTTIGVRLIE